ncbi:MAG TPA: GDP-L-fucose synthase [Burkholderiales bacterium]|nr:GDP-L-fucose synthase [Burkholderiales bacterium]
MTPESRVYVAGHRGLAGSAIARALRAQGYANLVVRTHAELELTDAAAVAGFFAAERPEYVFLAAAKVGGILANSTYPAEFIFDNLAVQTNVIHSAWRYGAKRLLFLGSSCIYPRDCPQPIREEYLLSGPLEPTNRPYAVAKIAGVEMLDAYNRQYGTQFLAAMPTNLYGPGDNYDPETSHVLAALIRKFHEAKARGGRSVVLWGSGTPRREFMHSDDMAAACVHLMRQPWQRLAAAFGGGHPLVNVGCGEDLTIRELAGRVREAVGAKADIELDRSKPDGTPQKLLDVSRLARLGWRASIPLDEGLAAAYRDFLARAAQPA